jgi:hypothetical protein
MDNLAIPDQKRGLPTWPKKLGTASALGGLICSGSLWIAAALWYLVHFSWTNRLTGFDFLKITAVGAVLSMISALGRVKLAIVAVPAAVAMFFLVMYIMGS